MPPASQPACPTYLHARLFLRVPTSISFTFNLTASQHAFHESSSWTGLAVKERDDQASTTSKSARTSARLRRRASGNTRRPGNMRSPGPAFLARVAGFQRSTRSHKCATRLEKLLSHNHTALTESPHWDRWFSEVGGMERRCAPARRLLGPPARGTSAAHTGEPRRGSRTRRGSNP